MRSFPRCLVCPVCGAPPVFATLNLTPWFCGTEDCIVLSWDPYSTLEENLMDAAPGLVEPPTSED
jgi:hypothetical protein